MFEISWSINKERSHVEITASIALGGFASKEFQAEVSATNVEIGCADSSSEQRLSERKLDFCRKFPPQSKDFQEENVTP